MTAMSHPNTMEETQEAGFTTMQAKHLHKLLNSLRSRALTWATGISITTILTGIALILMVSLSNGSRLDTSFAAVINRFDAADAQMESHFDAIDANFAAAAVQTESRFDAIDANVAAVNQRFDTLITRMDDRTDALITQMDTLITRMDTLTAHLVDIEKLINERLPPAQ